MFIAFAPVEEPEIAVVVVAEHGASGTKAAAPIAKTIIDSYMTSRALKASVTTADTKQLDNKELIQAEANND